MRIRNTTMAHYVIGKEEEKELRELAKKAENEPLVSAACEVANDGLADVLYLSLTKGKGYRTLERMIEIPSGEDDFYAYRRRALYNFKVMLKGREADGNLL